MPTITAEPDPLHRPPEPRDWQLAAEAITLRIRWFGLLVGYVLVNALGRDFTGRPTDQVLLNAILTLGACYALVDTWYSYRGRVFLSGAPLAISLMEAVFIGLLCHFDRGVDSPFRFYYFLSVIVCAIRYSPRVTWATALLHGASYGTLFVADSVAGPANLETPLFMLVLLGWVTWAATALASLVKESSARLAEANTKLEHNQGLLEDRIAERTRELQESQAMLVQQEKQAAFGLLAAGIAHEVGNPLAAISSVVQMLRRRGTDDYTGERLRIIDEQLRRIQRTLRELVDFGRPAKSEPELCDVRDVIDAALSIAKYYKRKKGKTIVTRYAEGLPPLRCVRDQLVQVVLNLVLNAMDATEEGGTIAIGTHLDDGWIHVTVADDGPGIAPEHQAEIFAPYFTTKSTGTGLGLFVCRHLLESTGNGRIELTESSPAGTMFTVSVTCEAVREHPDVPFPSLNHREEDGTTKDTNHTKVDVKSAPTRDMTSIEL